jgi:ABC-type multidrug transport system ATPase subunit
MGSEYAIEAEDLRRTYRARTGWLRPKRTEVEAVRGVTFTVGRGELFGLLGPNGAGKTTTIKLLNTLLIPTSGTARVCGHDVETETREVRRRIGYVFGGDRGLYDRLSALDNLRYFAELYGVAPRDQKRRIAELLELSQHGPTHRGHALTLRALDLSASSSPMSVQPSTHSIGSHPVG